MTTPFTTLADWARDWSNIGILNELILAMNERRSVCGQHDYPASHLLRRKWTGSEWIDIEDDDDETNPLLTGGEDVSHYLFWRELQEFIETVEDYQWRDPESSTTDVQLTLARLRTLAGLNPSGFTRRIQDIDEEPSYGLIQPGDIVQCPWLIEELQAAFTQLQETYSDLALIFPTLYTGEYAGCDYPEKSYYPDFDATPRYLARGRHVSGIVLSAMDASTLADDYLEIAGTKLSGADLIDVGDFGCPNGVIGLRYYKSRISLVTFSADTDVPINLWDTKRSTINATGKLITAWDFTNRSEP